MELKYPKSKTSVDDMCEIIKFLGIKQTEYTDCTVLYEVTLDQLRAIHNIGKEQAKGGVMGLLDGLFEGRNEARERGDGVLAALLERAYIAISMRSLDAPVAVQRAAPPSHTEIERTDVEWWCDDIKQLRSDMEVMFDYTNQYTASTLG